VPEHRVKAAYLLQFLSYVEWPPQAFEHADSPLVIGVVGAGELAAELAVMASDRRVNNRAILVRTLRASDPLEGLHAVFVARTETERMAARIAAADGLALLTVTETAPASELGGAINFVIAENRVRFDVAIRSAEQRKLKISSRLLAVARKVISESELPEAGQSSTVLSGVRGSLSVISMSAYQAQLSPSDSS
jgi:hypothetical protein